MIETAFSAPLYITIPIVLTGYCMACLGAGLLLLRLFGIHPDQRWQISPAVILATGFILGLGTLASLWLLVAIAGWFSIEIVGVLCISFAAGGLYVGRNLFFNLKNQLLEIWYELRRDTWGWKLIAALTFLLCLLWITSLGRPLSGDATAFYMALAKLIAYSHRLSPFPGYENFTNIGLIGELHFAALMSLHSPDAARLFSWPIIITAGIMLASLGRLTGMGRRGQWLAMSMLFSSSAVIWISGDGKVDLFAVALGLAAYYWTVQLRFARSGAALLLIGLLSGFAIVAKLSYAIVMAPSVALLVLWAYETELRNRYQWRQGFRSLMGGSLVILAGLLLAFIPHFIKNGLLYGNPISPIGSGGTSWMSQVWYGPETTQRIALTYPLALTYGSYWAQYGNISPLILAFLPLSFYLPRPQRFLSNPLVVITLTTLVGTALWVMIKPSILSPRYILALLLLFILLPAYAAEYASQRDHKPYLWAVLIPTFTIIVLISVILSFTGEVFVPSQTVQYLSGELSECGRDGENCSAMQRINRSAEMGTRVYLATYDRYWLRGDLMQCVSQRGDSALDASSSDQFWQEFYQDGYDFLIVHKATHAFMLPYMNLEHPPEWVGLSLVKETKALYAYQVKFKDVPWTEPRAYCHRLGSSTIWGVVRP